MSKNEENLDKALEAVDLGTEILKMCDERGLHENIVQASLGNAWFRLCFAMEFTPRAFNSMLSEIMDQYKKIWDEKNENQNQED